MSRRCDETHGAGFGVDAAGVGDEFYAMQIDRVFYVGGLGSDKRAEVVTSDAFEKAVADPLCKAAGAIVDATNGDRYEDVMNFARASLPDDVEPAEARMLWVDKLGFDVRVVTGGNGKQGAGRAPALPGAGGDAAAGALGAHHARAGDVGGGEAVPARARALREKEEATDE